MLARLAWCLVVASVAAPVTFAGSLAGLWSTENGDAHVSIEPCADEEGRLCGRIVWLDDPEDGDGRPRRDVENPDPALHERPILDMEILRIAATPDAKGVFRDGTIYDPKKGKTYRCKATLEDDDVARLRGYVGVSLLGRTARWRRLE